MKYFLIFFSIFSCTISAQKVLPMDSLKVKEVHEMFADDYGNLYFYQNKDFSFSKYDSLSRPLGQMRFTVPYKIQDIQNPLNIVLFSENAQEIKWVDQNLVEIQKVDLSQFGFIKMAYVEDQQQVWLLDGSTKRLLQYRFRQDEILQAHQMYFDMTEVKDMIVYKDKLFILSGKTFDVYNFKGNRLYSYGTDNGHKLRRENDEILLIGQKFIVQFDSDFQFKTILNKENTRIVDKNNSAYYEVIGNKIYLYPLQKTN